MKESVCWAISFQCNLILSRDWRVNVQPNMLHELRVESWVQPRLHGQYFFDLIQIFLIRIPTFGIIITLFLKKHNYFNIISTLSAVYQPDPLSEERVEAENDWDGLKKVNSSFDLFGGFRPHLHICKIFLSYWTNLTY